MQNTGFNRGYNVNVNKSSHPKANYRIILYRFTRLLELLSIISSVLSFFLIIFYSLLRIYQGNNVYSYFIYSRWFPIGCFAALLASFILPESKQNFKNMYFTSVVLFFLLSFYMS